MFDKLKDMLGQSAAGVAPPGAPGAAAAATEAEEGAEMARIDPDSRGGLGGTSEEVFGPLAVLMVGFLEPEVAGLRSLMLDMEADMVKVVPCSRAMLQGSLLAAMETEGPQYEQPPLGQRRALFFSGMYGSEVTEVIAAYRDAGLPPCVFAALVPNNANRAVAELLEAVWKDHAEMTAKMQLELERRDGRADDSY